MISLLSVVKIPVVGDDTPPAREFDLRYSDEKAAIDAHGPVKSIVLPSVAVEHKVNAGPFARRFPDAAFYAVDAQYSFPVPLPSRFLGLPSWTQPLPASSSSDSNSASSLPWGDEFEHEVLTVFPGPASAYQDAAFFHRPSKTLVSTDLLG